MNKTHELTTVITPGVAAGLLALYATSAITANCLAHAAIVAVAILAAIGACTLAVDASRASRRATIRSRFTSRKPPAGKACLAASSRAAGSPRRSRCD